MTRERTELAVPREKLWPCVGESHPGSWLAILFGFQLCNCSPLSIPSSPYPLFMGRDITTSHVPCSAGRRLTTCFRHVRHSGDVSDILLLPSAVRKSKKNGDRMSLFFVRISWKICPCTLQFSCWLCLVLAITMCISVYLAEIWCINTFLDSICCSKTAPPIKADHQALNVVNTWSTSTRNDLTIKRSPL